MSLVNDMLRDLDARRRDVPARGIGAEKLVPASEQPREHGKRRTPLWFWLVVPTMLVALVAAYLLYARDTRDNGQLPPAVFSPSVVSARQPALVAATSAANETVNETLTDTISDTQAVNEAAGSEMAALAARLRELEVQNQALLRAQESGPLPPSGLQTSTATAGQSTWQPRQWSPQADATADGAGTARVADDLSSAQQQPLLTAAVPPSTGSTVRSSRELSFAETDLLRVQQALTQWNGGQQLAALQALDTFTYEHPEAHQSREMLAKLLIQQGEAVRAMQVADLGLTIAPRRNGYKKVKARLLLDSGQAAQAVTLLSNGRPGVSDDVEYHDLLATGLLSSAAYEEAAVTYESLLEIDQRRGRWWYGLAASLEAQGRTQDAARAYEQALRREDLSASLRQGSQQRLQAIRQTLP